MSCLTRFFIPMMSAALILTAPFQLFAQEEANPPAEEATPAEMTPPTTEVGVPSDVSMPTDVSAPAVVNVPAAEQPQIPPELLEQISRDLENILGPLDNLRCSITSVGFLPAMEC